MEIPAFIYFSLWSITGAISLFLGIKTLDQTDLSVSVPTLVMSSFKYSLAISTSHSSTYSLMLRPKLRISAVRYYLWLFFFVLPLIFSRTLGMNHSFVWYSPVYSLINLFGVLCYFLPQVRVLSGGDYTSNVLCPAFALFPVFFSGSDETFLWSMITYISNFFIFVTSAFDFVEVDQVFQEHIGLMIHYFVLSSIFFVSGTSSKAFPLLVLAIALFTSVLWAAFTGDERFQKWVPRVVQEHEILAKLKKMMEKRGRLIEFAVGMVGTILFQNFFKLTSFDHVVAFLYLGVAWLSNIALLMTCYDFGIFNFILANVIVGCTQSQFGLHGTTWLVYGVSILLYGLRLKLESLIMVRKDDGKDVIVWRE